TRRPRTREPGRERRMLGLASLERRGCGALGALVAELSTRRAVEVDGVRLATAVACPFVAYGSGRPDASRAANGGCWCV
ncbi:hypothetical protein AB0346_17010, partial [Nocardia beijingensis]|uniref:hypothetical protein n=1 Tax=Nocardia beijingensis TaxID=95162 RepID=UPI00344D3D48